MWQTCRPTGRLFYLVLAIFMMASGVRVAAGAGSARNAEKPTSSPEAKPRAADPAPHAAASPSPQSGPTLTNVIDTVYLADGTPAQGVLVITWPAFVTASGTAVGAGTLDVTLGTGGALNVALAANAGANPPGNYYTVVYQLGPGEVRTEYWIVPTSSPATLAEVRSTPGAGTAAQPVSMQYVNTALSSKANDTAVVHLAGTETVTGTKTFSTPPNVPTPVGTGDVANKAYVDTSIEAVGAGNYLPTAGGAMTGPLTLSGNPTAPLQSAPKQYVDSSVSVKADLIAGLVPTNELGSGAASGLNCLLGSGAWGPCGSSANATAIQSVPVASGTPANGQVLVYSSTSGQYAPGTPSGGTGGISTSPSASQSIVQPFGSQMTVNNLSGTRYVTGSDNWSAAPSGSLSAGLQATVTLAPCPLGIDTTSYQMYFMYVQGGGGTAEPVLTQGGTCTPGAASGTVVFTPRNAHSAGYTIGSASSGIQEAINDACGLPTETNAGNANAHVILPATGVTASALPVYGSIFAHCSRSLIEGHGTLLSCSTRDRCMFLGDQVSSNHYGGITLRGVNFTSTVHADGCLILNTQRQANVVTITTASACSTIQTGDRVNINFTDNPAYWGNHGPVTVSGTSITYSQTAGNLASVASPGTIAIENAAVEDNSMPGTMEDIKSSSGGGGSFNQFFVMDDDEAATIRNFDADGTQGLTCTANHCGSYVYAANWGAPVIWIDKANISPQCGGNGVTVYDNNVTRVTDSVMQGFGMWGVNTMTILGNYGGTELDDIYMEEGAGPCTNPYLGSSFGAVGIIYQANLQPLLVRGGEQPAGHGVSFPFSGTAGSTQLNYYVIAHDTTAGIYSAPLFAGVTYTNGGAGNVSVQWPHVPPQNAGDAVVYDIVRMQPSTSLGANAPSFPIKGSCSGGSITSCGSVATAQAQCSGLVCSYTDSASSNTSSYAIQSLSWEPLLQFWPANVVFSGDGSSLYYNPLASFDTEPADVVSVDWNVYPQLQVRNCADTAALGSWFGGAWEQCLEGRVASTGLPIGGLLFQDGIYNQGSASGLKGRINFEYPNTGGGNIQPHHIITLVDSNFAKTLATIGFRPANDPGDTYIGVDATAAPGAEQLAFGSPVAISNYIGNAGDNSSYLERLTASGKVFNVPVNINGNLTVTGICTGCGGGGGSGTVNSGTAAQVAMYSANGAAVSGDSALTDNGSTLTYAGSNGIAASSGAFSGSLTVNGQLLVAGPWMVSSPVPGTAMAAAGAGTSALGVSNDGNFYISANAGTPQKVATTGTSSFFSNLFQEDANDVGEYGATAQNLHVYSSYTNSSTWQRTSLGFDSGDGYAVVRSESSTTGGAPGLGFWVNSGLKWVVDASSNFKPWTDQTYNVGSFNSAGTGSGLRPGTVYVAGNSASGSGFELGKFANQSYELCNDTTNGTIINGLAVLTTAGCASKPSSALTSGAIGVVVANAGNSGVVTLARTGSAYCSFDGSATVIGDFVVPSSIASGGFYPLCHDAGATQPTGTQVLGRVLQASSGSTTVQMFLDMPGSTVSNSASYSIPWLTTNTTGTAITFSATANKAELWGVVLTFPLTTTQVTYDVSTADNTSNTYDIGVLNSSGTVVAHIGSTAGTTFAPSTGWKTLSWTASATLQPGKYYLAITSSCISACAQVYGGTSAGFTFLGGSSGTAESVTAGGTLNNGITIPADNPTEATIMAWEIH